MRNEHLEDFFRGKKVKVFGTTQKAKMFVLPTKLIKQAYPFLIASALMFGCNDDRKKEVQSKDEWQALYEEVIDKYHLLQLKEKEPLPQSEINALINNEQQDWSLDDNFNHLPENQENFWEIIKRGIGKTKSVQNSLRLSEAQKKEYQITAYKMLSQISRIKGTKCDVDLSDYNNLKTFLYFERVLAYGDNYEEVLEKEAGIIDERNEVFGRYYKEYDAFYKKAKQFPEIEAFSTAFYNCDKRFMLHYADSAAANKLSMQMLDKFMKKQDIRDKDLWYFANVNEDDFCNAVLFYYRRGATVELSLGVDPRGDIGDGNFSPLGTTIIHELQHIMQKKPSSAEKPEHNRSNAPELYKMRVESLQSDLMELGPSLCSLALEDQIYKKIKGIAADEVIEYGGFKVNGKEIKLGETAVWFYQMMEKYPHQSVDKLLTESEVFNKIREMGGARTFDRSRHLSGRNEH